MRMIACTSAVGLHEADRAGDAARDDRRVVGEQGTVGGVAVDALGRQGGTQVLEQGAVGRAWRLRHAPPRVGAGSVRPV
jgi:hypothetical protein